MIKYNLVLVLDELEKNVLTIYRTKSPYKGLYNFPGGKVDLGEVFLKSAYRELEEETGITKRDIKLVPFIDFVWHPSDMKMKVFIGKLNKSVDLKEELHPLSWHSIDSDFFDMNKYAGEGNLGHMIQIYKLTRQQIKI